MNPPDNGFEQQLHASLRAAAARPPAYLLDQVLTATDALPQRPAGWHLFSWPSLAVAATAVLALAVAFGTGLPQRVGILPPPASASPSAALPASHAPSPSVAPSTRPSPTASPTPVATATPSPLPAASAYSNWERLDLPDAAPTTYGGGLPRAVVAFRGEYVAIGTINAQCCADGDPSANRGLVWLSTDGRHWQVLNRISTFAHSSLHDLLTDGSRLFAYGSYAEPNSSKAGTSEPSVWVSTDGRDWTRHTGDIPTFVAFSDGRFIGASNAAYVGRSVAGEVVFSTSTDGVRWQRTAGPFAGTVTDLAFGPIGIPSSSTGEGSVSWAAAVGRRIGSSAADGSVADEAVVWETEDGGEHWTDGTTLGQGSMQAVVPFDGGFAAVGFADTRLADGSPHESGAVWTSQGGNQWTSHEPWSVDGLSFSSVFTDGFGLVVSGAMPVSDSPNAVLLLVSTDGTTWSRVADTDAFSGVGNEVTAAAPYPTGILAVGYRWDTRTGHPVPVVWVARR